MSREYPPSSPRPRRYRPKWPWALLLLVILLAGLNHYYRWMPWPDWFGKTSRTSEVKTPLPAPTPAPRLEPEIIDYNKIKKADPDLGQVILERKKEFGLDKSVDMIVRPEESIKIGKETIPLKEILDQIKRQQEPLKPSSAITAGPGAGPQAGLQTKAKKPDQREVAVSNLTGAPAPTPAPATPPAPSPSAPGAITRSIAYYGVYVARQGDNLWDIHFSFLKEYFKHRGVAISEADARKTHGPSTGVERILKYAENMVYIFNVKTRRLDDNIHLLEPEEKVVIFNLTNLHLILGGLKQHQISRIVYDGKNLYVEEP